MSARGTAIIKRPGKEPEHQDLEISMSEDEVATLVGNGKSVVGVRVNRGIAYGEVSVSTYIQLTCNQDAQTLMLAEEIAGDMARKYSESFLRCILEDLNNEAAGGST